MAHKLTLKHLFFGIALMLALPVSALDGSWRGDLSIGQFKLPLVFNFSAGADGKPACSIDSPSQGAKGIPADVVHSSADSIAVECRMIGASFRGRVADGRVDGTFSQRGQSFPLSLAPEQSAEQRRPQTPRPPYPYTAVDTAFRSADGTKLAATLTLPLNASSAKVPAVVMVTGSGPQNRDEEIMDHKPFAVIADYLARNGVASLRYDDRGVGQSEGNFLKATTYTFKDDAAAAVRFMRNVAGIGGVGVLGHSEGGTIAFMLGADKAVDFIVSLAGMAGTGKETLMRQNEHQLSKFALSNKDKENSMALISALFDEIARQSETGTSSPIDIDSLVSKSGLTVPGPVVLSLKSTQKIRTPWFDTFLTLNPDKYLKRIHCPILAVNGELDTQVHAATNIGIIKASCPAATTIIYPSLNHMLQHAVTGEPSEYDSIRQTVSPDVLTDILSLIKSL